MDHVNRRESALRAMQRANTYITSKADTATLSELILRQTALRADYAKFCEHHENALDVTGDKAIEMEHIAMEQGESVYFAAMVKYETAIAAINHNNGNVAPPAEQQQQPQPVTTDVRLPPIVLPTFDGTVDEWLEFKNLFTATITENSTLSDVQRLHYLKSQTKGEALHAISGLSVTGANFQAAWNILTVRYDNVRYLINAQFKQLFSLPTIAAQSHSTARRLLNVVQQCTQQLNTLGLEVDGWDAILVYMIGSKLDNETFQAWEIHSQGRDYPTLDQLKTFIENRCRVWENVQVKVNKSSATIRGRVCHATSVTNPSKTNNESQVEGCIACKRDGHYVGHCQKFIKLNIEERRNLITTNGGCYNCMRGGHTARNCKSSGCRQCGRRHHTLLHRAQLQTNSRQSLAGNNHNNNVTNVDIIAEPVNSPISTHLETVQEKPNEILLATAIIQLHSEFGYVGQVRALLDNGSQSSFVSEACVQRFGLPRQASSVIIRGLNAMSTGGTKGLVSISVASTNESSLVPLQAHVVTKITSYSPAVALTELLRAQIANVRLADSSFNNPPNIDILLGADVYGSLLLDGLICGGKGNPTLQNTIFGWVVFGPTTTAKTEEVSFTSSLHCCADLQLDLKRFWELEQVATEYETVDLANNECERHFIDTHQRDSTGRFSVRLPFNADNELGESRRAAQRRLLQIEHRLSHDQELSAKYNSFMREYVELEHMEVVEELPKPGRHFYLPHHPVMKTESSTTKVRVVFDGSAKTSNGRSLNNVLMIGPKTQGDLFDTVMRFRRHMVAFTADITKMYRQILVSSDDRDYQRIIWRFNTNDKMQDYRLTTVTYGTASAAYTAVRCLRQLAIIEGYRFPAAANALLNDFYVDDLLSGTTTVDEAIRLKEDIRSLLGLGGFEIRKWVSNSTSFMNDIPADEKELQDNDFSPSPSVKMLGIIWYPKDDAFGFKVRATPTTINCTKRSVLSDISKLFDPMGWISPCIVKAKMLIQEMWILGIGWDDPLPTEMANRWNEVAETFDALELCRINRYMGSDYEIHGFCDASQGAYAAVIYSRYTEVNGEIKTNILISKTRVAPVQSISIPRLELCAAHLLSRLLGIVGKILDINLRQIKCYAWCDSTVALAWLRKLPSSWKTFVANRVSQIQSLTEPNWWRYIQSKDNPADIASRGCNPIQLANFELWWNGPEWLRLDEQAWPKRYFQHVEDTREELNTRITSMMITEHNSNYILERLSKFSSLNRVKRVTAYMLRFLKNARCKGDARTYGHLIGSELDGALRTCIGLVQEESYHNEFHNLRRARQPSGRSQLIALRPFIGEDGLLRVGGRIRNSDVDYNQRHQIILPLGKPLTKLIISDTHFKTIHGGVQLMMSVLQSSYWICGLRNAVKAYVRGCVVCARYRAAGRTMLMGDLPRARVVPSRPFSHTGVDFAGPVQLRPTRGGRGYKTYKGYIAVFVCFCTKAIHLEAVSDLSTQSFLATLKRFISRRGLCRNLYSDCETNFIGAKRYFGELYDAFSAEDTQFELANSSINWHLNPPHAPHFGGLWEAAVKSTKYHLRRTLGNTVLTFEELTTILAQIEACLNSRPLWRASDDIDSEVLTPAHFLIGESLIMPSDYKNRAANISLTNRWQLSQSIVTDFWKKWKSDYLKHLQARSKWFRTDTSNCEIGEVVLLKDDCSPPTNWSIGRIVKTFPGTDGRIRVVDVQCKGRTYRRAVNRLVLLVNPGEDTQPSHLCINLHTINFGVW